MRTRDTLLLTDFDGTLYRGLCPALTRGVANADLALALCLFSLPAPARCMGALVALVRIARLERALHRRYRAGEMSLSDMDEQLVRRFAGDMLARCAAPTIARAARAVSRLCHRDAWPVLERLASRCEIVVVSKSFDFVLEEVRRRAARRGIDIVCHGIRTAGFHAIDRVGSVLRAEDKHAKTTEVLHAPGANFRRAIVIGDTEDDLAMKHAAAAVLGDRNVLFVAMQARDGRDATRSVRTWKMFGAFLESEWVG